MEILEILLGNVDMVPHTEENQAALLTLEHAFQLRQVSGGAGLGGETRGNTTVASVDTAGSTSRV